MSHHDIQFEPLHGGAAPFRIGYVVSVDGWDYYRARYARDGLIRRRGEWVPCSDAPEGTRYNIVTQELWRNVDEEVHAIVNGILALTQP